MTGSFPDHFSAVAADYAAYRPVYPDALFEHLARLAPARDLAWDCATGNGQAAIGLAPWFARVVATDASDDQLAAAPVDPRVEYRRETAEASSLADGSADLVVVAQALHWLDLDRFYGEARRVLRPRGILAAWGYATPSFEDPSLTGILHRFRYETLGSCWPAARAEAETGYRSLPFPFDEVDPPRFEMSADWPLARLLGYVRTWSAVRRLLERGGEADRDRFESEMTAAWGEPSLPLRIRWPLGFRIGISWSAPGSHDPDRRG